MPHATPRRQREQATISQLKVERSSFESLHADLADHFLPARARFQLSQTNKGHRRNLKILDSTGVYSADILASAFMASATSPAQQWFRLTTPDPAEAEFGPVKSWLQQAVQAMLAGFLESNLYDSLGQLYQDWGVFGLSPMLVEEDFDDVIHTTVFPVGSYWIANDHRGRVRVFYREFRLTVRQLIEEFSDPQEPDWSLFSTQVRDAWDRGQLETWIDVGHLIEPNPRFDPQRLHPKYKAFASSYFELGATGQAGQGGMAPYDEGTYLRESGYDTFPVLCPRWHTTGGDVYATHSPGISSLGDVRQLQIMDKRAAQAIEKQVNPPMVALKDMQRRRLSILPGDTNYSDNPDSAKAIRAAHEIVFNLEHLRIAQREVRQRIYQAFYVNVILMMEAVERREITATEIEERKREKLLALGRVLQRLDRELLNPLVDMTFDIMLRQGRIPPPPPELEGAKLKVEYQSIMALAQKMLGVGGMERFAADVAQVAQVRPDALDKFDADQYVDELADRLGVPPRIVVADEDVVAIREARERQAAQQAVPETVERLSGAAEKLSRAKMDEDSVLARLARGASGDTGRISEG